MSMKLSVNGAEFEDFVSANVEIRLDALSNTFSFSMTAKDAEPLPFTGGEACQVVVDGETVLTGYIEVVNISGDGSTHTIDIQGRDKTGDLLDSSIEAISDIRAPITLKSIIEKVLKHIELGISVVDNVSPEPFNKAEDLAAPEAGQNAFEFIEIFARKRHVLLTSDGDGNIVIAQSSGAKVNAELRHQVHSDSNNVQAYSVSYDSTGRFNLYRSASQLNPIAALFSGTVSPASIVSQSGGVTDAEIRTGRQHILIAEAPSSNAQNDDRATWEANIRKARGKLYSATVDGYKNQAGDLWSINTLVTVISDFADINAEMLVNTVSFSLDVDGGQSTTISMVERNAYSLVLDEPETENVGGGFFDFLT